MQARRAPLQVSRNKTDPAHHLKTVRCQHMLAVVKYSQMRCGTNHHAACCGDISRRGLEQSDLGTIQRSTPYTPRRRDGTSNRKCQTRATMLGAHKSVFGNESGSVSAASQGRLM
jgi:hypothetical protein